MKSIAGSLKLELAQFREIEAFEQFGDSLDKSTQDLLKKGKSLTELLKQFKYTPLPLNNQIFSVYAGVKGYLDSVPLEKILTFEQHMHSLLNGSSLCIPLRAGITQKLHEGSLNFIIKISILIMNKTVRSL